MLVMNKKKEFNIDPERTFVTSDHHFCSFGCLLKRTTEEDDARHIATWNEIVGKDDLVLYVGDFCDSPQFKDFIELKGKLNGHLVLIKGNHDDFLVENRGFSDEHLRLIFEDVVEEMIIDEFNLQLLHDPRSVKRRDGMKLIHGHTHLPDFDNVETVTSATFCCCACRHDWKPVKLADALKSMDEAAGMLKHICGMANKHQDETGLPMNIWIDEAGAYVDIGCPKGIRFQLDKARRYNPHNCGAMDLDGNVHLQTLRLEDLSEQDVNALRNFVRNNKYALDKVADQEVFLYQIWSDMIKGGAAVSEAEILVLNKKVDEFITNKEIDYGR